MSHNCLGWQNNFSVVPSRLTHEVDFNYESTSSWAQRGSLKQVNLSSHVVFQGVSIDFFRTWSSQSFKKLGWLQNWQGPWKWKYRVPCLKEQSIKPSVSFSEKGPCETAQVTCPEATPDKGQWWELQNDLSHPRPHPGSHDSCQLDSMG